MEHHRSGVPSEAQSPEASPAQTPTAAAPLPEASSPEAALAEAKALLQQGRAGQAEGVLAAALRRWPRDPALLRAHAGAAQEPEEARRRWKLLQRLQPGDADVHVGLALALLRLGRKGRVLAVLDDAAGLIAREHMAGAEALLPVLLDRCRATIAAGGKVEAVRQAGRVAAWFPDELQSHMLLARANAAAGDFEAADRVVAAAASRGFNPTDLAVNRCWIVDMRGDPERSLAAWTELLERYPHHPAGYRGAMFALRKLRRCDEAEAIARRGYERFDCSPGRIAADGFIRGFAFEGAWTAYDRGDFAEAHRRWTAIQAALPEDASVRECIANTRLRAQLVQADRLPDDSVPVDRPPGDTAGASAAAALPGGEETLAASPNPAGEMAEADLVLRFESLGNNCEFGLLQRHFGQEPIGLLRWNGIAFDNLVTALETGLAGIGDPEFTRIGVEPETREYFTVDTRYGMGMHTFIKEHEVDAATATRQMQQRIAYLRRKLVHDLRQAERIFVFRDAERRDAATIGRLHAAMRRFGDPALLFVRLADAATPAGQVELVGRRLMVGTIDRLGPDPDGKWRVSHATWIRILRQAWALIGGPDGAKGGPASPASAAA